MCLYIVLVRVFGLVGTGKILSCVNCHCPASPTPLILVSDIGNSCVVSGAFASVMALEPCASKSSIFNLPVSFVNIHVQITPNNAIVPHTPNTRRRPLSPLGPVVLPKASNSGFNAAAPKAAPNFPLAALIPWQVAFAEVGKASAGITNVVVLGPKLEKKKVKPAETQEMHTIDHGNGTYTFIYVYSPYRNTKAPVALALMGSSAIASIPNNIAIIRKPNHCILRRPMRSMAQMATK
jgi:hypothetical protein